MNFKILLAISLLCIPIYLTGQSDIQINKKDQLGRKQGHWIKKTQDDLIIYDGYFKDDHPEGEFKRYYENQELKSVLNYSDNGKKSVAVIYHPNGYIASKGTYVDQMKEGKWQFFSSVTKNYLICEEYYSANLRNGLSVKYYEDSTIAEKVNYVNDVKEGEWVQYYSNGKLHLKSGYLNGLVNGKFEVWYENGNIEFSGQYKNDAREGQWTIYNEDGTVKYNLEYHSGVTKDRQMEIDESNYLDSLEINKGKIEDPEVTGVIK